MEIVPLQYVWDFIGYSVHWDSVKDLEQEVDSPTGEKKLLKTLCVVGTPLCTVQYEPVLWGQYWVEMDLCRMHMPSASLVRAETVHVLGTAVK